MSLQSGIFSERINQFLLSEGKSIDELLLKEAATRTVTAFRRQLMEDRETAPGVIRMSAAGHCQRRQWYNYKGFKGEPLQARTHMVFLHGDMLEVALSVLGRLAGWNLLGKPDGEDEIQLDGVKGHPDDLLQYEEDMILVEYKSMSDYGFKKFEEEGIDDLFGYQSQASAYCEALNVDQYILCAVCKSTGKIADRVYEKCVQKVARTRERWETIKRSEEAPAREHEPEPELVYNRSTKSYDQTGRMKLGVFCSYCGHREQCFPGLQMEIKSGKPIFLTPSSPLQMGV